jgi:3-phosphoshikimate 1-carboxyvinyltransferase
MRLLTGLLAGQEGSFELVGDESLSSRPQERVADPLRQMGGHIETTDGHAPLRVDGSQLHRIRYELPVASAQVKTAVLFAGLYADRGPTTVVEPLPSRDHTERLLPALGARVRRSGHEVSVWPVDRLGPLDLQIPGDFSAAAPFIVAAALVPGSRARIHGVNVNPTRTGLLDVLERMGVGIALFNRRKEGGEPVGDLEVRSPERDLRAAEIGREEVPRMVDELPLFALVAGLARGESVVRGAEELHVKETDRIETVTDALRAIGIRIEARRDGFRIRGVPNRPTGGRIDARGDHRIAMLGAVAGLVSRDGVELEGADTVAISFPGFFELLDSVVRR